MFNLVSSLRSTILMPVNFVVTCTGQLWSKIRSFTYPIFSSLDGSIYHQCASLYGRVTFKKATNSQEEVRKRLPCH